MESDHRYYSRRAAEERRAAQRAITEEARNRHSALADLFRVKADRSQVKSHRSRSEQSASLAN